MIYKGKIARFYCPEYGFESIREEEDYMEGYVRLTEWVEVEMPFLPKEETMQGEIDLLREHLNEIRAEAQQKINRIEERIASLLALTHNPEED